MANPSVQQDYHGPDWPLGFIQVITPGTPVNIMSLVDPSNVNDPNTLVPPNSGATPALTKSYTVRCQQIIFGAYQPSGGGGWQRNAGNIYIMRKGIGGDGTRADSGSLVYVLEPGSFFFLASAPAVMDVYSPYRYSIDADNALDGCFVTLIIQ